MELNSSTNLVDVGRMLSAQEAQDFLASDRPVFYTTSGVPFEATILGPPQASTFASDAGVMEDTFDAAGISNDSAETSSDSADVSVTDDVESGSDVDSLESLANELESLADDLKAGNDSEAVDAFESAAGKLARAAEELRENPGGEDALEEFETAADELKEAAHGLEGEIDGDMYEQLTSAADGLERAADHMLGAEDGESSMASAMEEATGALDDLVSTMTDVMDSGDPLASLDELTNELASVSNEFMDNVDAEASEKFDAATERLENAVDELQANPSDEGAIEEFEAATDDLKEATQGLEGEIDDGMYEKLTSAVDDLEKAGDRLMATDGDPDKMDGILSDAVDSMRDIVDVADEVVASVGSGDDPVTSSPSSDGNEPVNNGDLAADDANEPVSSGDLGVDAADDPVGVDVATVDDDIITIDDGRFIGVPGFPGEPQKPDYFGADRIESMADNLKHSAIDMAGTLNVPGLNKFEGAVDRLETAADELAMSPKDEGAINEFKAAANELKDVTHGLDGDIRSGAYERATSAVDKLVNAADRFTSTGDTDSNSAMHDAADALRELDNVVVSDLTSDPGRPFFFDDAIPFPRRELDIAQENTAAVSLEDTEVVQENTAAVSLEEDTEAVV